MKQSCLNLLQSSIPFKSYLLYFSVCLNIRVCSLCVWLKFQTQICRKYVTLVTHPDRDYRHFAPTNKQKISQNNSTRRATYRKRHSLFRHCKSIWLIKHHKAVPRWLLSENVFCFWKAILLSCSIPFRKKWHRGKEDVVVWEYLNEIRSKPKTLRRPITPPTATQTKSWKHISRKPRDQEASLYKYDMCRCLFDAMCGWVSSSYAFRVYALELSECLECVVKIYSQTAETCEKLMSTQICMHDTTEAALYSYTSTLETEKRKTSGTAAVEPAWAPNKHYIHSICFPATLCRGLGDVVCCFLVYIFSAKCVFSQSWFIFR